MLVFVRTWKSPDESELSPRNIPKVLVLQLHAYVEIGTLPSDESIREAIQEYNGPENIGLRVAREQIVSSWILKHSQELKIPTFSHVGY